MAVVSLKPLHKEAQDKMAECLEVFFWVFLVGMKMTLSF